MKNIKLTTIILPASLAAVLLLTGHQAVYAQNLKPEVEERGGDELKVEEFRKEVSEEKKKVIEGKLRNHIKIAYGYDTNPLLGSDRSDDDYELFRFGMDYRRTFAERHQGSFSFTATQQNYNEITALSNSFGNLGLDYKFALTKQYILGAGYNLSLAYYDNNSDSEFMLNKMYLNFQQRFSAKFYHKIQYEFSVKHYDEALALLSSVSTYKDNRRRDFSDGPVYSIGYMLNQRFSTNVSLRYINNDSNSDYQDYYDYHLYDLSPRLYYKFSDKLTAMVTYSQKWKSYEDRLVGSTNQKQVDRTSKLDVGLTYEFNESHSVNFNYSYNYSDSNSPTFDYVGNSIEAGWRYNF